MVGGLVKSDFRTHSGSHQSTAWIQNPSSSRVWQQSKEFDSFDSLINLFLIPFLVFATLGSNLESESKLSSDESQSEI